MEKDMATAIDPVRAPADSWRFATNEPENWSRELDGASRWSASRVKQVQATACWPWPVVQRSHPGVPNSFFVTASRSRQAP